MGERDPWGKPLTGEELRAFGAQNVDEIIACLYRFHHKALHLEPPTPELANLCEPKDMVVVSHNTVDVLKRYPAVMPDGDWNALGQKVTNVFPDSGLALGETIREFASDIPLDLDGFRKRFFDSIQGVVYGNMSGSVGREFAWPALEHSLAGSFKRCLWYNVALLAVNERDFLPFFALMTQLYSAGNYIVGQLDDGRTLVLVM